MIYTAQVQECIPACTGADKTRVWQVYTTLKLTLQSDISETKTAFTDRVNATKKLLHKKSRSFTVIFFLCSSSLVCAEFKKKKKDKYGWNFLLCCYQGLFLRAVWAAVSVLCPNLSCIPAAPAALRQFLTTLPLHLQSSPGLKTWNILDIFPLLILVFHWCKNM